MSDDQKINTPEKENIDILKILELLPHRYPFVMVDRVLEYDNEAKTLLALKNITFNEPQFTGHFPENPVMPGVLMIEALAQASGLLVYTLTGDKEPFYFAGIEKARFKRIVRPGDQLHLHVKALHAKRNFWKFEAEATVEGDLACKAEFMIAR
jgi:3-hydroxyacyl-[acyl-carrier-protein] dehydratase